MHRRIWLLIVLAMLVFTVAPRAFGALSAVGPVDQAKGFPQFYTDSNGLSLDLMEAADVMGISAPVEAGNAFSALIGFGAEGFWWSAEASLDDGIHTARLVLALEAAFSGGEIPVDGEQSAFGRVRYRLDGLTPGGSYTVIHPFATATEIADAAGSINVTLDVGGFGVPGFPANFNAALISGVGPFLKWDTFNLDPALQDPQLKNLAPAYANRVYLGNPNVPHAVTGGTNGNSFTVTGPGLVNFTTNLFAVTGRIFNGTSLIVSRATFDSTLGVIDVFATSNPAATLTAQIGATQAVMTGDVTGQFFAQIPVAALPAPAVVTVTATNPPNASATVTVPIKDIVTITQADFVGSTVPRTLTVTAQSSDISAVLTGAGVTNPAVPPPNVTVTSDLGGSQTVPVNVVSPPAPPVTIPVAPSGLTATGVGTTANLSWIDNSANETDFTLQRATNVSFTIGLTQIARPANSTSFSNTGLVSGVTYFYRIRANGVAEPSAFSSVVSVVAGTTGGLPTPTPVISAILGTAGRVVVSWTDSSNETSYVVQRATNAVFTATLGQSVRAANSTTFTFTNLISGQTYFFRVIARNAVGNVFSNVVSVVAP